MVSHEKPLMASQLLGKMVYMAEHLQNRLPRDGSSGILVVWLCPRLKGTEHGSHLCESKARARETQGIISLHLRVQRPADLEI